MHRLSDSKLFRGEKSEPIVGITLPYRRAWILRFEQLQVYDCYPGISPLDTPGKSLEEEFIRLRQLPSPNRDDNEPTLRLSQELPCVRCAFPLSQSNNGNFRYGYRSIALQPGIRVS